MGDEDDRGKEGPEQIPMVLLARRAFRVGFATPLFIRLADHQFEDEAGRVNSEKLGHCVNRTCRGQAEVGDAEKVVFSGRPRLNAAGQRPPVLEVKLRIVCGGRAFSSSVEGASISSSVCCKSSRSQDEGGPRASCL